MTTHGRPRPLEQAKPSPALVVAILAVVAALAGSAVAEVATTSKLTKKERRNVRKIARKQIDKRFPIDGSKLADGAVAGSKLADGAVAGSKLADGAVTRSKLADGAVDGAKVLDGSLGTSELADSIPAARVTRSNLLQVPNGTTTPVAFNAERYDTADLHSNTTNSHRLTAPVAGIYEVTAQATWAADANGFREVELSKNDATIIAADSVRSADGVTTTRQEVTTQVRLQAGDFVEALVRQTSGGELPLIKQNEFSPEFSMTWLAPGP